MSRWMVLALALALALALVAFGACSSNHAPTECEPADQLVVSDGNPRSLAVGEAAAGSERCDVDTWNSVAATTCTDETRFRACEEGDEVTSCRTDADCGAGRCLFNDEGCSCVDTCQTDDDCGAGEACLCSAGVDLGGGEFTQLDELPRCVPAECRSAADCDGQPCGIVLSLGCKRPVALRCRAPTDACLSNADCAGGQACGAEESEWVCQDLGATCE